MFRAVGWWEWLGTRPGSRERGFFLALDPKTAQGAAALSTLVPALWQQWRGHTNLSLQHHRRRKGSVFPLRNSPYLKPPSLVLSGQLGKPPCCFPWEEGCYREGQLESNQTLPPMKLQFEYFPAQLTADVIQGGKGPFWP